MVDRSLSAWDRRAPVVRRQVFMNEIVEMIYQWHQGVGAKGIRRSPGGHVEERQDGREGGT